MNKFQEAIKELENGIKIYVNRIVDKSPKDMTYSAIIYSAGIDGYNIKLNNIIYENIPTIGGVCAINEIVRVLIPQNNYNNMVILKSTDGGGGSGGAVSSVNGKVGVVILNYQDVGALPNTVTVPTKTSQLTNDSTFVKKNDMTEYAQPIGNYALESELFSKNYNDLIDKPIIPTKTSQLTNDSSFVVDANYNHTDNNLTDSLKTEILDNSLARHIHSNKSILDIISQVLIDKWNTVTNKVDKVEGKGLSTNDYTNIDKNKLFGIANGAEVNIQSDWNISESTSDSFIKNKPTKLSQFINDNGFVIDVNYVHTDNNFTNEYKNRIDKFELTVNLDGSLNLIYNEV